MNISNRLSVGAARFLLAAGLVASSVFVSALPTLAHAATYAFVNNSNEVSSVTANDWQSAIATAFNISVHSGVLLLNSQNGNVVGRSVGGI